MRAVRRDESRYVAHWIIQPRAYPDKIQNVGMLQSTPDERLSAEILKIMYDVSNVGKREAGRDMPQQPSRPCLGPTVVPEI